MAHLAELRINLGDCCLTGFSWGTEHTHRLTSLLTPEREPTIDQSNDSTKVQFNEPMSLYWGYVQDHGQRDNLKAAILLKTHSSTGDHKQNLHPWSYLQNLPMVQQAQGSSLSISLVTVSVHQKLSDNRYTTLGVSVKHLQ